MASFTDNPQLLTNFNPYVQQLPIDAMREVGMYKQAKYDEGVQKIQTSIDNVAGLDVIRDVDKGYLQSKLNDLSTNLKSVAGGDFSNFQLVNSTAGMANQIAKDKTVQSAVMSTAKYRKGAQEMENANREGKSSPSNNWLFNKSASDWLNSDSVESQFNDSYQQYTNYSKESLEVIKELVKNENIKDVALEYDADGKVTGILDATTRTKIAGVTPERIQQALLVGLSPAAFKQMQIDGRYNYSNKSTEQFSSDLASSYKKDYDELAKQKDAISNSINSTTSVQKRIKIKEEVDALDRQMNRVTSEYQGISKLIVDGDSEAAKAQLHTTKWMNNFAQTFAHSEVSQTYEANPYVQPAQFRESQKQDWTKFVWKFQQDERFEANDNYYKSQNLELAKDANARENKKAQLEAMYGSVPVTVDQSTVPEVILDDVIGHVNEQSAYLGAEKTNIMNQFGKKGDEKWLSQQEAAWKAGKSVDPLLNTYFNNTDSINTDMNANKAMILDINRKADSKFTNINSFIPEGMKSLVLTSKSGRMTFTPQEVVEFNEKSNRYIKSKSISVGTGGASTATSYDIEKARKNLSPKEFYLFTLKAKQNEKGEKSLLADEKAVLHYSTYLRDKVNAPYSKVSKEKNKWIAGEVKNRVMSMQGTATGIPLSNEIQKTSFGNALMGFADNADKQGGIANSPGVTSADIRKVASGIQNATFTVVEGTPYQPEMYEVNAVGKDGDVVKFRVSPEQKAAVFGNRFDASPAILAARPYINQMYRTGANTTSLDGKPTTPANSFISRTQFPSVKHYGVSGNVVRSGNGYSIRINLTDPITNTIIATDLAYPAGGLIDEDKIAPALQNLSDAAIYQMIHNKPATAADIQQLKQAAKKP